MLSVLDLGARSNVVLVATPGRRLQGLLGLEEMCSMEMLKRDSQSAIQEMCVCAGHKWMSKNKVKFQVKNFHDSLNLGRSTKAEAPDIPPEKLQFLEKNLATILEEKLSRRKRADLITNLHRDEEQQRSMRRPRTRFSDMLRFRHAKTKDSRNIQR